MERMFSLERDWHWEYGWLSFKSLREKRDIMAANNKRHEQLSMQCRRVQEDGRGIGGLQQDQRRTTVYHQTACL